MLEYLAQVVFILFCVVSTFFLIRVCSMLKSNPES